MEENQKRRRLLIMIATRQSPWATGARAGFAALGAEVKICLELTWAVTLPAPL